MESELKPCEIADALEKCDWAGASIGNKAIVSLAIEALRNTRPAPAATDTGLETVDELWEELVNYNDRTSPEEYPDMALISKYELADFVSRGRSQAAELLAAERAKYRDAMEKLVESQRETLVWQQRAINLKSDNAAKDKLLKEANHV